MKELSRKWLTLDHYRLAIETDFDGVTVRVWKPFTMGRLPAFRLRSVLEGYVKDLVFKSLCDPGSSWDVRNPDLGVWDAYLTLRLDSRRKVIDVYFCSLLVRPFSDEAREYYSRRHTLNPLDRMLVMFDSRSFDELYGYSRNNVIKHLRQASAFSEEDYEPIYHEGADSDLSENVIDIVSASRYC